MIKHVLSILVALFLCSVTLFADLRSDSELLVDSAYSQAMSGNLPHAVAINMEGLQAVPEDSMAYYIVIIVLVTTSRRFIMANYVCSMMKSKVMLLICPHR